MKRLRYVALALCLWLPTGCEDRESAAALPSPDLSRVTEERLLQALELNPKLDSALEQLPDAHAQE